MILKQEEYSTDQRMIFFASGWNALPVLLMTALSLSKHTIQVIGESIRSTGIVHLELRQALQQIVYPFNYTNTTVSRSTTIEHCLTGLVFIETIAS